MTTKIFTDECNILSERLHNTILKYFDENFEVLDEDGDSLAPAVIGAVSLSLCVKSYFATRHEYVESIREEARDLKPKTVKFDALVQVVMEDLMGPLISTVVKAALHRLDLDLNVDVSTMTEAAADLLLERAKAELH